MSNHPSVRRPPGRSLLLAALATLGVLVVVLLAAASRTLLAPHRRSGYAAMVRSAGWTGTPGQFAVRFTLSREDGTPLPSRLPDLGATTMQNGRPVPLPRLQFPNQKTEWLGIA